MSITKEITRLEKSAVKLSVIVPKDEVCAFYDKSLEEVARDIQIKGFRKGKAPKSLIEQKFRSVLREQITNELISKTIIDLINAEDFPKDAAPLNYMDPQIEGEPKIDLETDLHFAITYDVAPQLENIKYEGLEVTVDYAEITDEDIERELEEVRDRNSIVIDRDESSPVQKGDIVTLDFCELDADGSEKSNTKREDFTFTAGSEATYYKFDEDVLGLKTGEEKIFDKTMPKHLTDNENEGNTIKFKVKIKSIKEKKLPELDDELAQDVDEKYNTLDDLKAGIKKKLTAELEDTMRGKKISALLDAVCEANPFDVPESMIRTELYMRISQFVPDMREAAALIDSESDFVKRMRPEIELNIKKALIMQKVSADFPVTVDEEEIEKEIELLAERINSSVDEVKRYHAEEAPRAELTAAIKNRKLNEIVLAKNTVKDGNKVSFLEIAP
ncbi:MAG: trigger factor [Spirochaetaceae bacterium]|nr:trigger factor [Spirochaetaceae bacterium]